MTQMIVWMDNVVWLNVPLREPDHFECLCISFWFSVVKLRHNESFRFIRCYEYFATKLSKSGVIWDYFEGSE